MNVLKNAAILLLAISFSFNSLFGDEFPWDDNAKDGDELQLVLPFLPENPIILEAGAHHGEHTLIIAEKWSKGRIYAFEPVPASFTKLEERVSSLHNVKIFPFGLFSKTDNYVFNINTIDDGSSSIFPDNHIPGVFWYNDHPITVFCMNLDEWAVSEEVAQIDYMWLDMEGAEYHTLLASPNIVKTVSAISTEINFREFRKGMPQFQELRTLLESYGFVLYKMWGVKEWQGTAIFIRSDLLVQ